MDIQEIIDLLENSIKGTVYPNDGTSHYKVNPHKFNQALTLLKQQPKATSIGNKIREIASKDILGQTKLVRDKDILNQAADRLDAWWKYINELKEEVELLKQKPTAAEARLKAMYAGDLSPESRLSGYKVITDELRKDNQKLQSCLDRAEAINKDLLEACEGLINYHYHNDMGVKPPEYRKAIQAIAKAKKGIKRDGTPPP